MMRVEGWVRAALEAVLWIFHWYSTVAPVILVEYTGKRGLSVSWGRTVFRGCSSVPAPEEGPPGTAGGLQDQLPMLLS